MGITGDKQNNFKDVKMCLKTTSTFWSIDSNAKRTQSWISEKQIFQMKELDKISTIIRNTKFLVNVGENNKLFGFELENTLDWS